MSEIENDFDDIADEKSAAVGMAEAPDKSSFVSEAIDEVPPETET